jgi:hypothetical protein
MHKKGSRLSNQFYLASRKAIITWRRQVGGVLYLLFVSLILLNCRARVGSLQL